MAEPNASSVGAIMCAAGAVASCEVLAQSYGFLVICGLIGGLLALAEANPMVAWRSFVFVARGAIVGLMAIPVTLYLDEHPPDTAKIAPRILAAALSVGLGYANNPTRVLAFVKLFRGRS